MCMGMGGSEWVRRGFVSPSGKDGRGTRDVPSPPTTHVQGRVTSGTPTPSVISVPAASPIFTNKAYLTTMFGFHYSRTYHKVAEYCEMQTRAFQYVASVFRAYKLALILSRPEQQSLGLSETRSMFSDIWGIPKVFRRSTK